MESVPVTRRLAAIVIADVVGYTRLMERDDTGTFAKLRSIRDEVVDPAIVSHDGRIVKTAGDGLLAEFPSALAALRASVQIQHEMAKRNVGVASDDRIDYRIGVNLGDIMVDGTDIAGDGVNVAARLESVAEPGGICVSGSVREQLHGQLLVGFVDIGEQQVKNIERPIRVFRVVLGSNATGSSAHLKKTVTRRSRWLVGAGALVVLAFAVWFLQSLWRPAGAPIPPTLSLAILPFAAPSGSPSDVQFADSLTQDVTTAMGKLSYAKVAANALVAGYKPGTVDIRELGQRLNVRYVVEGEVRRVSDETVVTARLIDTMSGAQAWSDRLSYSSLPPRSGQAVPSIQLTKRLRAGFLGAEVRRAVEHPASSDAMNLVLRGYAILHNPDRLQKLQEAQALFQDALRLDPNLVPALSGLTSIYDYELEWTANPDRANILPAYDALSSRAIAADRSSADAWSARSSALQWLGRWDEALVAIDQAAALDESDIDGPTQHAWILIQTGHPEESLPFIERALALDPLSPSWPNHFMCKAKLFMGRYEEAVTVCEEASAENNSWLNLVYLCAAYAQHGDLAKAVATKDALLKQKPGYTIAQYRNAYRASPPAFFDLVERHLAAGLRKAGVPEK